MIQRCHRQLPWTLLVATLVASGAGCGETEADGALDTAPDATEATDATDDTPDADETVTLDDDQLVPLLDDGVHAEEAGQIIEQAVTGTQVVYVNFDGVRVDGCASYCSDAVANRSFIINSHFEAESVTFAPFGNASQREHIVNIARQAWAAYDVAVTTARPTSGPYTMVVVGAPSSPGKAAGVAPVDCDNRNPGDVAFVYAVENTSLDWIGNAVVHEAGHSFGLTHVTPTVDAMHFQAAGHQHTRAASDKPRASFTCFEGDIQDAPAMLAVSIGLAMPDAPEPFDGTFADDDGSPHEVNIEKLVAAGITQGCTGGSRPQFCPARSVTRGQMVVFLQRGLGLATPGTDHFDDDDGVWFEDAANAAADAGITLGCSQGPRTFCGSDEVTRAQMAAFLTRAFDYPAATTDHFDDDDGSPHEDAINRLAEAGVTQGCAAGTRTYCPSDTVTRAQMASFLVRALAL